MPHHRVGPDLSFLHKEIQPGLDAFGPWLVCLDEQASHAHIPYTRDILLFATLPVHPHISVCRDTGRQSPGWRSDWSRERLYGQHGFEGVDRPIHHKQAIMTVVLKTP